MAIKVSNTTVIDNSRNILNVNSITASTLAGDGSALTGIVAGLAWKLKSANYTAQDNDAVIANTNSGSWTLTLPASPSIGNMIRVVDYSTWGTYNLIVARNGSTIEGDSQNMTMDVSGASVDFVYNGTTWQVYAQVGAVGGTVVTSSDILATSAWNTGTSTTEALVSPLKIKSTIDLYSPIKAWARFSYAQNTSNPVIQASDNIASLTYVNYGEFQVTFTNSLVDANYCVSGNYAYSNDNSGSSNDGQVKFYNIANTGCRVVVHHAGGQKVGSTYQTSISFIR